MGEGCFFCHFFFVDNHLSTPPLGKGVGSVRNGVVFYFM